MRASSLAERAEALIKSAKAQQKIHGVMIHHIPEEDLIDLLNFGLENSEVKIIYLNKKDMEHYKHKVFYKGFNFGTYTNLEINDI
jgi:hypothetical protein